MPGFSCRSRPRFGWTTALEQLGHSNQSIYSPVIKALIDEFVAEHADRIDTDRIVVAGLSNGGFMTLRLCADYPEFFAAGLPCCAPWYNATDEDVDRPCQDAAVVYALQGR
ncbi:MAG: prolyl oligopeptidase family serine peptidase [Collinsella sp.]